MSEHQFNNINNVQYDLITRLYSKDEAKYRVDKFLANQPGEQCAFLLIELNNFNNILNYLGYQFGNAILMDAAEKIRSLFRDSDVAGRCGSYEFVVFMTRVKYRKLVTDKATDLCSLLKRTYEGVDEKYFSSCSIGISYSPENGENYEELYNAAYKALCAARQGENGFEVCNSEILSLKDEKPTDNNEQERFITNYYVEDVIYNVFEMLYETKDLQATLAMILEIIGKRFNVSRCYIFEHNDDGVSVSNTYEWCAENIEPEISTLQNIPVEDMIDFFSNYNSDGILCCSDLCSLDPYSYETLSRQGIKSLMHCGFYDMGVLKGFIGFDDCIKKRIWRGDEIANLGYISRILSIFLLKKQVSKELWNAYEKHTKELERVAYYDELTGVYNLAKFKIDATKILNENQDKEFMVIKFDIHQFKMVNEMLGFEYGNSIIKMITEVAKVEFNSEFSVFAREGSDKFILFKRYDVIQDIEQKCHDVIQAFNRATEKVINYKLDFRFGRFIIPKGETNINTVLENVNIAHIKAKEQRQAIFYEYDEGLKESIVREVAIESRMGHALENNEFIVYLQPKYFLDTQCMAGAEALVRWKYNGDFIAYPNQFIPLFEKNGFVTKLDMYMLDKTCEIIKEWIENGEKPVTISINFSRLHLRNENFVNEIVDIVNKYGIPKKYIEIELTESTIFNNEEILHCVLAKLHEFGFSMSMDDFGTGYSSLGLLKNLPVDSIKIDRSFFVDSKYLTRAKIVIESVIQMAKRLGIFTVAEGIETQEQIDFLRTVGCDIVQGYYFAKPMEASEFKTENINKSHN